METLPTRTSARGQSFTVADFYEAGREELSLTLVSGGDNLRRAVEERRDGQILLVPEQYSHEAERELCAACGDGRREADARTDPLAAPLDRPAHRLRKDARRSCDDSRSSSSRSTS